MKAFYLVQKYNGKLKIAVVYHANGGNKNDPAHVYALLKTK